MVFGDLLAVVGLGGRNTVQSTEARDITELRASRCGHLHWIWIP